MTEGQWSALPFLGCCPALNILDQPFWNEFSLAFWTHPFLVHLHHELSIPSFVVLFWVLVVCFGRSFSSAHSESFGLPLGACSLSTAGGGNSLDGDLRLSLCRIRGPPALPPREGPPRRRCRGTSTTELPHLGPTGERSAVFMRWWFQGVNNMGDF